MTQRSVKYMINTARMRLKREWVVVVVPMTHSTYSNPSSVAAHLVVSFPLNLFRFIVMNLKSDGSYTELKILVGGRWEQQRKKAKEGRGCNPSPQGFFGGSLQWDI